MYIVNLCFPILLMASFHFSSVTPLLTMTIYICICICAIAGDDRLVMGFCCCARSLPYRILNLDQGRQQSSNVRHSDVIFNSTRMNPFWIEEILAYLCRLISVVEGRNCLYS